MRRRDTAMLIAFVMLGMAAAGNGWGQRLRRAPRDVRVAALQQAQPQKGLNQVRPDRSWRQASREFKIVSHDTINEMPMHYGRGTEWASLGHSSGEAPAGEG